MMRRQTILLFEIGFILCGVLAQPLNEIEQTNRIVNDGTQPASMQQSVRDVTAPQAVRSTTVENSAIPIANDITPANFREVANNVATVPNAIDTNRNTVVGSGLPAVGALDTRTTVANPGIVPSAVDATRNTVNRNTLPAVGAIDTRTTVANPAVISGRTAVNQPVVKHHRSLHVHESTRHHPATTTSYGSYGSQYATQLRDSVRSRSTNRHNDRWSTILSRIL